ncbi:cell division protein ZapA [Weissella bombi]|uniref:Cell division protein ZapA n=1 Tax=Weissella bombi TaxID=1505725 RepID=A0A1C4BVQ5_9LACO|nr:cell division protein ZapA [Weissella bombi]SCC10979.1 cell division protein ZapA [Weissella bombi]
MAEKTRFKGTILGKELTVTASESQAHMKAVFDLANSQLEQMQLAAPKLDENQLLTLLAINALSDQLNMQVEKDKNK